MKINTSQAEWCGNLKTGSGTMVVGESGEEFGFSFRTRFEDRPGVNPEQLLGAAHAGCFSMALSHALSEEGYQSVKISTRAEVKLEPQGEGFAITGIHLDVNAEVKDIDEDTFRRLAQDSKENCPVSKALAGPEITLSAKLNQPEE